MIIWPYITFIKLQQDHELVYVVHLYKREKMTNIPDKNLIFKQISEGNKEAFDTFFERYYPKLVRFAQIFVDSQQQAEDVVSDVLTNMLINRKKVFLLDNFDGYLYSSIKNKALSSIRKNKVADSYSQEERKYQNIFTFVDPHHLLVEHEFENVINKVIENLPPKRKMVFKLIREEGLSYCQVADLLDISDRTVEVHLSLAIKALRKKVEEYLAHGIMSLAEN
jgi:RNA polymerase sigma-70 factor (family 1)